MSRGVVRVPSLSNPADSYYQDAEPVALTGKQGDGEAGKQPREDTSPQPRLPAAVPQPETESLEPTPRTASSTRKKAKNRTGTYGEPHVVRGVGMIKIGVTVSEECARRLRAFSGTLDPGVDARNKWIERVIMRALDSEKRKRVGSANEFTSD